MFNLESSSFHVPRTTVRHLLSVELLLACASVCCLQDIARDSASERTSVAVEVSEVLTSSETDADKVPINCMSSPVSPAIAVSIFSLVCFRALTLQCFDAVGWAAGRASGL